MSHPFNGVELCILVHHNYMPEKYHKHTAHGESESVRAAYERLNSLDMVKLDNTSRVGHPQFKLTEKGRFHVNAMQSLPIPQAKSIWTHESVAD
jgi:hypothetical protein